MQEVREAIAKLGNIAQKYMSTNAEEFVHIVIGEPEPVGEPYSSLRKPCTSFREACSSVERYANPSGRVPGLRTTPAICAIGVWIGMLEF